VGLGLAVLVAAGGCSADADRSEPAVAPPQADGQAGPAGAPAPEQKTGETAGGGADLRVGQRAIVYTGSMTVRVDKVDAAAVEATSIVTSAGGFVGGDKRSSDSDGARAELELRVPAERFHTVVDRIAGIGRPERRDIDARDVTEETVDLDARIATQRARVDSGRRLLSRAQSIGDLVTLESEVAKREADLASLEAKKRRLADLTALSTVTVTLLGPDAPAPADDDPELGFLVGLRGGWTAFLAALQVALTVLGALLPFLVTVGALVAVGVLLVRRARRRAGGRPAVPAGAGSPGVAGAAPHAGADPAAVPAQPRPADAGGTPRPDSGSGTAAPQG
jgi:hypothetical protein